MQLNLTKGADLQDVPLISDFAKTERQRQMLKLILSRQEMARPFMAPPGLPDDREAALRKAFDDDLGRSGIARRDEGARPGGQSGERRRARRLIAELYATPKDVVEETKKAIGGQ